MNYLSLFVGNRKAKKAEVYRQRKEVEDDNDNDCYDAPVSTVVGIPEFYSPEEDYVEDLERPQQSHQDQDGNGSISPNNSTYHSLRLVRQLHQKRILMLLILVLGAAASAAFLSIGIVGAQNETQKEFETDALDLTNAIRSAWDDYQMFSLWIHESCHFVDDSQEQQFTHNSNGTRIIEHTGFCSRNKFQHLYEYIQSVGLEFVAMQYVPNITHDERDALEEEARLYHAKRNPNMTYAGIQELELSPTDGSVVSIGPSPAKPWYFPNHYLLPLERNEGAVDIDMYSYRQEEITKAFETMKPVMGTRVRLFQDPDPRVYGAEYIHPGVSSSLDDDDDDDDDDKDKNSNSRRNGLAKMVIKIPALIERAARVFLHDSRIYLFDVTDYPNEDPIFLAGADLFHDKVILKEEILYMDIPSASKTFRETITIMDKKWQVVVQPLNGMYEEELTHVLLGGILMFVACIFIVVWFHTHMDRVMRENRIKSIAQREKSQLALQQVKRERHLNDFIAHEVRNPLCSAMAALSFVLSTAQERVTDPEVREALLEDISIVDGSLDYINDLLKNMLDIHKSAANEMRLDIVPTCILEEVFEPVSKILVPRCGTIRIILECNPPNLYANIDRLRMKQVILNLTINATKFVDTGFIRLRAEVVNDKTCIFVEDSRPGIPEQKRHRLFEKFQESLDMRNQGTGIGLYVCKNLTKLMGGTIYLDETYHSEVPDCPGARFVIDLQQDPIYDTPTALSSSNGLLDGGDGKQQEPSSAPSTIDETCDDSEEFAGDRVGAVAVSTTAEDGNKHMGHSITNDSSSSNPRAATLTTTLPNDLSVLFIDDDAVLRKLFARSVTRVRPGWTIDQAAYGEEALNMVETKHYDIIFIDQYMAGDEKMLLGTETVVLLRHEKNVASLICGLSANDMREPFMDAGADAFMIKPFPCEKKALERELMRVLGSRI